MNNRVNIRKIARESGLSIASISRVVNGKSGVSEENRKKITALLEKYNYVADSHLSSKKKIALLCGDNVFGDYISRIFDGVHAYCVENTLNTAMIFKNNNLKMTELEQVRDQQCSGAIVILPSMFDEELEALAKSELPVILIDRTTYTDGLGFINHDAYSGSCEAADYLLSLGHRNIGYIEFDIQTFNHLQRIKAYKDTLKAAGIEIKPEWHLITPPEKSLWEGAYIKMQELLRTSPEITAVMTTNDNLAMGAIKAIWDSGKRVPEDISVIGFDNYQQGEYLHPALTTVNHPIKTIGYQAAKEIDLYLKNPKNRKLPQEILPTKLVIRDSTAPCPKKSN
jgi:DNA-binding LacI/PurR family transcriptional regulator